MINLVGVGEKLQLAASVAGDVDWTTSWADWQDSDQTGKAPGSDSGNQAAATTIDIVPAPAASERRNVQFVSARNNHATTSNTITIQVVDAGGARKIAKVPLAANELLIINDAGALLVYDANGGLKSSATAGLVAPTTNEFRLSGVSGASVMTSDSTTLSTVYLTQHRGNRIALWDGVQWQIVAPASEVSLAITGRTTDLPFDVFAFISAGTVALEFLNWSSATARATALARQDGVLTKSGDATRRWLGTIRPRSATTFHWVRSGVDAPAKFDLFNADNRLEFSFSVIDTATSHAYNTATWRQWAGSVNYQVDVMAGVQEENLGIMALATSRHSVISNARSIGVGFDLTTQPAAGCLMASTPSEVANQDAVQTARLLIQPAIGRHFAALLQIATATATCTWIGDDGGAGTTLKYQSGIVGEWTC